MSPCSRIMILYSALLFFVIRAGSRPGNEHQSIIGDRLACCFTGAVDSIPESAERRINMALSFNASPIGFLVGTPERLNRRGKETCTRRGKFRKPCFQPRAPLTFRVRPTHVLYVLQVHWIRCDPHDEPQSIRKVRVAGKISAWLFNR